jgi:LuxR family maltose regulon positive regulatory protein
VLDDYHVINAPDVLDGTAFLLDHLPPQIHLVIASRAEPALPLARLRGRGSSSRSVPLICASPLKRLRHT